MKKSRLILLAISILLIVGYLNITPQSTGQTKSNSKIKSGSVVISDSEYDLSNWTAQIRLDSNGATHSYNQETTGGNPGSYLQMIYNLPLPPGSQLSAIMVLYKYTGEYYVPSVQGRIDSITYRENLRHEQPNGFVLSFPVVYQSGKIYRANNFSLMFTEPGVWHTGIKTGLVQNSFINIDGSGTRPIFSATGDTIYFGFERSRSRGSIQVDTSYNTFIHGSDNFSVTIYPETVSTTLTMNAPAGSQVLEVAGTSGFSIGDNIVINPGGATEETNTITGFGSMLLQTPLQFDHNVGEVVQLLISTSVEYNDDVLVNEYSLYQNYPNPFNPTTKIRFSIPPSPLSFGEGQGVRLVIYDLLGSEVATLVDEEKPAGSFEIEFDASNLSSGMYLYRIHAGSFIQTKKMILLK